MNEFAELVLQFGLPTLVVAVGAGVTAWFSIRTHVQQHVWQKVFEQKWQIVTAFSVEINRFSRLMQELHNIRHVLRDSMPESFVRLFGLMSFHWTQEERAMTGSLPQSLFARFPLPNQVGQDANRDKQRLDELAMGYHNAIVQELWTSYAGIREGYASLILHAYDPSVAKKLEKLAMDTVNVVSGPRVEEFEFPEFFDVWGKTSRLVRVRLRQDLQQSASTLTKALRINRRWLQRVEEEAQVT